MIACLHKKKMEIKSNPGALYNIKTFSKYFEPETCNFRSQALQLSEVWPRFHPSGYVVKTLSKMREVLLVFIRAAVINYSEFH